MSQGRPLEVVVLDDIARFAGHVWQYLAENIGFGVGKISDDGRDVLDRPVLRENEVLPIPSGEARVRWVNAGAEEWHKSFAKALREAGRNVTLLIDVRGPVPSRSKSYDWQRAVKMAGSRRFFLVSSYLTGAQKSQADSKLRVRSKTWKLLEEIAAPLRKSAKLTGEQILVTGAGFELAQDFGGAEGLGTPGTEEILMQGWRGCGYGDTRDAFEASGYPIPKRLVEETSEGRHAAEATRLLQPLRQAAAAPDLDAYWNEALQLILDNAARASEKSTLREQKTDASQKEHEVREAFRQAFLNYDWGYLNQALDATALGWTAWLSTNYTGFADRALTLERRHRNKDEGEVAPWTIVSTSSEALYLRREILHADRVEHPVLFKLHGHVEHLLTMAVAGQDKELYSTLSLPVDSLHEVYTAAELYLTRRLAGKDGEPVLWHVVGHGLRDALLVDVLVQICRSARHREHWFLFVNPPFAPDSHDEQRGRFKGLDLPEERFLSVRLTAKQYMARLRRHALGAADWNDLEAWRDRLVG